MYSNTLLATGALVALLASSTVSHAQSKAEFEALQKKVAALEERLGETVQRTEESAANKIKLSDSVTELRLSGDLRMRYQYDDINTSKIDPVANDNQRDRWRFRLRLNADFKLGPNFFGGVGLATGQTADSNAQTFGDSTGGAGFDNFNIYINKAFIGWKPNDWATVILGKQANPLTTTDLVWDPDINPQGAVEVLELSKALFPKSKLSVSLVASQFIFGDNNEYNADSDANTDSYIFAQQIRATYQFNKDTSLTIAPGFMTYTAADLSGLRNTKAFSDATFTSAGLPSQVQTTTTTQNQVQVTYSATGVPTKVVTPVTTTTAVETTSPTTGSPRTVNTSTNVQRSPQTTTTGRATGLPTNVALAGQQVTTSEAGATRTIVTNNPVAVSGETRAQNLLTAPGDFSFKLGPWKSKFYWDFAVNLTGAERFHEVYGLSGYHGRDSVAWLAGVQIGESQHKGDWVAFANYREIGIASIDPNLNDSDFAQSRLNVRGFKLGLSYNLTEAVNATINYSHAWGLRDNLYGGQATGGAALADSNSIDSLQVDLNLKF